MFVLMIWDVTGLVEIVYMDLFDIQYIPTGSHSSTSTYVGEYMYSEYVHAHTSDSM